MKDKYSFISGNQAAVLGALSGGAEVMYGYPITPATEILQGWINQTLSDKSIKYLQTEDETSAGFAVIGSILGGAKAFTASAGPGHVLMQDPLSMAENLRLPFVGIMMQRGGPSTGTVNFSQQEVNLAAFGGNGDGLRIVYSASSVEEMYYLSAKIFSTAWKYMFPTILLGDGYLGKMESYVDIKNIIKPIPSKKILKEQNKPTHLRNCYSSEEDLAEVLKINIYDWNKAKKTVTECELYKTRDSDELILAHGLVAAAAKKAVDILRGQGRKIGLFRPITIHPLDDEILIRLINKAKNVYLFESSYGQFERIIKYYIAGLNKDIICYQKPAEGYTPEEIINALES